MGLLKAALERRALEMPSEWEGRVFGMGATPAGVDVTPTNALQYAAVFACIRVLAEDVSSLPLIVYRRLERGKTRAHDHPLYRVLHDLANGEMTSMELRETLMGHVAAWGNAYAEKEFDRAGRLRGLWPLRPDRMQVRREAGRRVYEYTQGDGRRVTLFAEQVMHLRGLGWNGLTGYSPLSLMRNAVGLGLAAEEYGARFFGNGAKPPLVLMYPNKLTKEGQENLRKSWGAQTEGLSRANRVAVLEEGVKVEQIGIPPEDAQFLETRRFQALEIARIYRVPPHKIGDLDRATFSNIENQNIDYVSGTLRPWLVRWEQAITRDLLTEQERGTLFAEHLVDGLLRGDTVSRYQAYALGRQNGWFSANDVREMENMNPIEDGDDYLQPLNMVPVGEAAPEEESRARRWLWSPAAKPERRAAAGKGRRGLIAANRELFLDAMGRVVRRETNDLRQAAEKFLSRRDAGSFSAWLNEFYAEYEPWLIQALGPLYRSYGQLIMADAADEIDGDAPAVDVWAAAYLEELAARHVEKSRRKLGESLEGAGGVDELATVLLTLDEWRDTWPEYLAGRETVLAGNAAAVATYKANGVRRMRWSTSGQSYVCDLCRELNGKEIEIDGQFAADALPEFRAVRWPPLHAGCECLVVAV